MLKMENKKKKQPDLGGATGQRTSRVTLLASTCFQGHTRGERLRHDYVIWGDVSLCAPACWSVDRSERSKMYTRLQWDKSEPRRKRAGLLLRIPSCIEMYLR